MAQSHSTQSHCTDCTLATVKLAYYVVQLCTEKASSILLFSFVFSSPSYFPLVFFIWGRQAPNGRHSRLWRGSRTLQVQQELHSSYPCVVPVLRLASVHAKRSVRASLL